MLNFLKKINRAIQMRKAYKETFNELSRLDDRGLNDIGITRGEIHHIAMADAHRIYETNPNLRDWV